jgi:hypothetical protein
MAINKIFLILHTRVKWVFWTDQKVKKIENNTTLSTQMAILCARGEYPEVK